MAAITVQALRVLHLLASRSNHHVATRTAGRNEVLRSQFQVPSFSGIPSARIPAPSPGIAKPLPILAKLRRLMISIAERSKWAICGRRRCISQNRRFAVRAMRAGLRGIRAVPRSGNGDVRTFDACRFEVVGTVARSGNAVNCHTLALRGERAETRPRFTALINCHRSKHRLSWGGKLCMLFGCC